MCLWLFARTRSIRAQLLLVALVTTLLTAVAVITLVYALQYLSLHEVVVLDALHAWQDGSKQLKVAPEAEVYVVDAAGRVLYTLGATATCVAGETFGRCRDGPTLGEQDRRVYARESQRWEIRRTPLSGGLTLFTQAQAFTWFDEVRSFVGTLGYYLSFAILSAVPIALLLSLLMARPLVRRLHQIAGASRAFAAGDLSARTGEASSDAFLLEHLAGFKIEYAGVRELVPQVQADDLFVLHGYTPF